MTVNARSILFRQPLGWAFRRCSQIARTVQPSRLRRRRFFRSRDMLAAIFRSHASDRFSRHSSNRYPCQKSPSTKMTTRSFRNTKSGRPGRSLACLSGSRPLSSSSFLLFRLRILASYSGHDRTAGCRAHDVATMSPNTGNIPRIRLALLHIAFRILHLPLEHRTLLRTDSLRMARNPQA